MKNMLFIDAIEREGTSTREPQRALKSFTSSLLSAEGPESTNRLKFTGWNTMPTVIEFYKHQHKHTMIVKCKYTKQTNET